MAKLNIDKDIIKAQIPKLDQLVTDLEALRVQIAADFAAFETACVGNTSTALTDAIAGKVNTQINDAKDFIVSVLKPRLTNISSEAEGVNYEP